MHNFMFPTGTLQKAQMEAMNQRNAFCQSSYKSLLASTQTINEVEVKNKADKSAEIKLIGTKSTKNEEK